MRFYYHFKMLYLKKPNQWFITGPQPGTGLGKTALKHRRQRNPPSRFPSLANIHHCFFSSCKSCRRASLSSVSTSRHAVGLTSKKGLESTHFSPSAYHCSSGHEPLPPGCPGSWHQPSPCFHSLQSVLHWGSLSSHQPSTAWAHAASGSSDVGILPQGLCTALLAT